MARTISQIKALMVATKVSQSTLNGLIHWIEQNKIYTKQATVITL